MPLHGLPVPVRVLLFTALPAAYVAFLPADIVRHFMWSKLAAMGVAATGLPTARHRSSSIAACAATPPATGWWTGGELERLYPRLRRRNALHRRCARSRARLAQHAAGKGARYMRGRLPFRLAYQEPGRRTAAAALRREIAIKRLSRAAKLALIAEAGGTL